MFADMVLLNGKVITVDSSESVAQAVAIKFGRILGVGSNSQVKPLAGPETKTIDLKGRSVIPGLNDSHCHLSIAQGLRRAMGAIDAEGARSIAEILAKIAEQTKRTPKGEWINVVNVDESKLAEKRLSQKAELDTVAPDHPVMVIPVARISSWGAHFSAVNSKAFETAGVTKDTPDPDGGRFDKDPVTGELTGWVHERASRVLQPRTGGKGPTLEHCIEGIRWMAGQYVVSGLTCAYDGDVREPDMMRAFQELANKGELPLRMRLEVWWELLPQLASLGIVQGFGSDMLKIGGIKIKCDGGIIVRTAAVTEPYMHRPDYYGVLTITREELRRVIMDGYQKGYRFSVHADGDSAINLCLDVLEEAQKTYPRQDPRNRVLHCSIVNPAIIARIKRLGIVPSIFGPWLYYYGKWMGELLPAFGAERLERMFAARSLLDAGIKVSAHSDHLNVPYQPLMGIHALVNRKSADGQPIGMSQKISVMEAIKLYTINAAYHTFEEGELGSIEPGKFADIVVLGKDILTVPTESIIDIPIDMTIVGGKVVYQREA